MERNTEPAKLQSSCLEQLNHICVICHGGRGKFNKGSVVSRRVTKQGKKQL